MHTEDVYDLVIVGATPGGLASALRAAREGLQVLVVSHTHYIGGMISNGISCWDTIYEGWRAPLVEEFRTRVAAHYRTQYGEASEQLRTYLSTLSFEPHVGERVVNDMVAGEPSLTVLREFYPVAVERTERLLQAVIFKAFAADETRRIAGRAFIDASYEGDLLALAGVPYRVGREAVAEYNEPHAGKIFTINVVGQFPREAAQGKLNLRPFEYNASEIFAGSTGEGDGAIQAYNFRSNWSRDPDNRRYPDKPDNYDRTTYLVLLKSERELEGQSLPFRSTWLMRDLKDLQFGNWKALPNGKLNWNHGNFVGQNHEYPTASWPKRQEIAKAHRDFDLGLWYFLQNDEAVPPQAQARAREWGLSLDEFTDNDNFPYEMYVRESRRMVGRYVFTEHDASLAPGLKRAPIHADSVAIAEWAMDSHECTMERQVGSGGDGNLLLNEKTRPAQLPYRIFLPDGLDNLLVTFCVSASHVGFGTIRVEPTLMHIGETLAFAVVLAQREATTPAQIPLAKFQRMLLENGVMISFFNDFDMQNTEAWVAPIQYLGTKGFFASYDARPEQPLTRATGQRWAITCGRLLDAALDANEQARKLAEAAQADDDEPLTVSAFTELLKKEFIYRNLAVATIEAALDRCNLSGSAPLSRGDACRLIYDLI